MAITETPFIFTPQGEQVVKEKQPHVIDTLVDPATALSFGLEADKQVDETAVTVMAQQQANLDERKLENLVLYGGLGLAAILIISRKK